MRAKLIGQKYCSSEIVGSLTGGFYDIAVAMPLTFELRAMLPAEQRMMCKKSGDHSLCRTTGSIADADSWAKPKT
jgi:hypothetical protein